MTKYKMDELLKAHKHLLEKHRQLYGNMDAYQFVEVFEPGETIIQQGRKLDTLRYMISGKAKVSILHEDGNISIVHFVQPEEFLGELTFLDVEDKPKDVRAISQCIFLSVPMDFALRHLKSDAQFIYNMARIEGFKMHYRSVSKSKNQNYPLKNRLAAYILMSEHKGIYQEKHTETAAYLGVSYRHLLQVFSDFVGEGALSKSGRSYHINREILEVYGSDIDNI